MTTKLQIEELLTAYERATGMGSSKTAHRILPEIVRALVEYVEEVTAGPTDADIAFFQGKLEAAVERGDEENANKLRKQIELLEDAAVIYRLTRAPERRTFFVDVGTLPQEDARAFLVEKMAEKVELDTSNMSTEEQVALLDGLEAQGYKVCPPCDVEGDAPNKIDFGLDELVTRNPAPHAAAAQAPTGKIATVTISSDGNVDIATTGDLKVTPKRATRGTKSSTAPAPKRPKASPKKRS